MSKLAIAQMLWPPVPTMIFVSLFDWVASFQSMTVSAAAVMVYVYAVFAPGIIAVFWPSKRGDA